MYQQYVANTECCVADCNAKLNKLLPGLYSHSVGNRSDIQYIKVLNYIHGVVILSFEHIKIFEYI